MIFSRSAERYSNTILQVEPLSNPNKNHILQAVRAANGLAASAFVVTHIGAATAGLTWAVLDWMFNKRPTVLGIITGAVAGLVAITPASGFVNVAGAFGVGIGVAVICYIFVSFIKSKVGYDDSLDAFGVHGVGGMWGAIATGLWAVKSVNGVDGLFAGNPGQLFIQLKAVLVTVVFSAVATWILLKGFCKNPLPWRNKLRFRPSSCMPPFA
jgi:Amt family ammonium transporter